jgi:hypothetical protein
LEYVKPVPDFIAKLGLSLDKQTQERTKEAKLEDKFPKSKLAESEEGKDDDGYDYENAQIEDLANMLQGGPLASEQAITDQERLQAILKKRIALMDLELGASGGGTGERLEGGD